MFSDADAVLAHPLTVTIVGALVLAVLLFLVRVGAKLVTHVIPHFEGDDSLPKKVAEFDKRLTCHLQVEEADNARTASALEELNHRVDEAFKAIGAGNPEYRE